MKAKSLIVVLILTLSLVFTLGDSAIAKGSGHHSMLADKFFSKAHFLLVHQESLGLAEDQVNQIKSLKMDVKKELVRRGANIDIVKIDIHSHLWQKQIDVAAINGLIDQKYDLKKEKAKYLVSSYAQLKGMLTDEQMEKAKSIWFKRHQ